MAARIAPALSLLWLVLTGSLACAADQYFDSNGVKIRYTVTGTGEPVLLVHGFTASIEIQWIIPGVLQALAKDYQVIAFDCRGHGKSGKPHEAKKYGMEMVEDAVRLLDHLHIKRAHVVGYSMGAMLTSKLMVMHPDRLISATLGGAGRMPLERIKLMDALATSLEQGKGLGPLVMALSPPGQPKPTPEQISVINTFVALTNDTKALAAVVRSWPELSVADEWLKANRVPVFALAGAYDPLKKTVAELKGLLGGLEKTVIIADADHISAPASPVFLRELRGFLATYRRSEEPKHAAP